MEVADLVDLAGAGLPVMTGHLCSPMAAEVTESDSNLAHPSQEEVAQKAQIEEDCAFFARFWDPAENSDHPAVSTDGVNDQEFVAEMRRQGHTNWVVHNGYALDLNSEATANLKPETLAKLLSKATETASEAAQATQATQARQRLPPLQPWEATKLMAAAEQVLSALSSGRYSQGFGEMLLSHFRGWQGADDWARAEEARLASLVDVDNEQSREHLRRHLEEDLVVMLREVLKEVNRVQLAGTASSASSHCDKTAPVPNDSSGPRRDLIEEAALQAALLASADDDDDDFDAGSDEDEGHGAAVDAHQGSTVSACCHACDLASSSCCCCAQRAPRPGLLPSLRLWWQSRQLPGAMASASSTGWRFFCQKCASRRAQSGECQVLPLPFGGILHLHGADHDAELVEPMGADGSSWDMVSSPRSMPSDGDASWALVG
eukprot:gb/GFBE01081356.1/.p1 GENE.gb/GFBE01081356.1/~~gb/GFBE01081356.1/.p1  ORF type:complete len:433 (+),score=75.17 gb/GFBE01081356.1/:1-1299(+)